MADPAITAPFVTPEQVCALGWQTAKGTAASTFHDYLEKSEETDFEVVPNMEVARGGGLNLTGYRMSAGHRIAYKRPGLKLKHPFTARLANMLLESYFGGAPVTSNTYITEANDGANQLSAWNLVGVRVGINTASTRMLWVTLADAGGTRTVSVYKNSGKTELVSQGSRSGDGSITLTAQNNSGLSGTVTVAWTIDDADITLVVKRVDYAHSLRGHTLNYITAAYFDGTNRYLASDLRVKSLKIGAAKTGMIQCEAELIGLEYSNDTTSITEVVTDNTYMLAQELQITYDADGSPVILGADGLSLAFDSEMKTGPETGCDSPVFHVHDGKSASMEFSGAICTELSAILTTDILAAFNTNVDYRFRMTHSAEILNLEVYGLALDPNSPLPKLGGGKLDKVSFVGDVVGNAAANPFTSAYYQYEA